MAVIALLMSAWIGQIKQLAVSPRLLADDLQLSCTGARHLDHFDYAYIKTHLHSEEMVARIAPRQMEHVVVKYRSPRVAYTKQMATFGDES